MTIFFTADWHFSHTNIRMYCNRPFKDDKIMNAAIIQNYNRVVKKNDTCYILGDVAFINPPEIFKLEKLVRQLNGRKILILGNHDHFRAQDYIEMGFESAHTFLEVEGYFLTHDPAVYNIIPNKKWLCGHVHNLFKKQGNVLNVGVDVWNFTPVSLEQVNEVFRAEELF